MLYGCIGEKLGHSFSKIIHGKIANYSYELKEIAREDFDAFMHKKDFLAINVTIPYKRDVIPYLYYIDEKAKKIGAVNTIVNKGGKLYGYNTDYSGMKRLAEKNGVDFNGKKVLILGSGGTSKTANALASDSGAREVLTVSRSTKDGCITYTEAYSDHLDAEIIINTTPCGMFPDNLSAPIDIDKFEKLEAVLDAIYNPLRSKLVSAALKKGLKASGGLYMLVAQAVYASEKFLDREISLDVIDKIYSEILTEKENVVLIGMPGCGKTTLGKAVSELTGKEFIDTDSEIVKAEGKSIPEIFSESGETCFRKKESDIIRTVSQKNGCVIATGGGAILDPENVFLLKQNGRLYFINRPLESLIYTEGRPLAPNIDAIKALYQKRYPIYISASDDTVSTDGDIKRRTNAIIAKLNEYKDSISNAAEENANDD